MRHLLNIPLLTLMALGATGCAVGPDYVSTDAPLSDHYRNQAAVEQRTKLVNGSLTTWWTGFNDPLLAALVEHGLAQNLDIVQASARLSQSRALLRAAGAALLPTFDATAQAARSHLSVQTPLGRLLDATPNFDRNGTYGEVDLGASWDLDIFGGNRRTQEAARAEYEAAQAGVAATQIAVAAQIADAYIIIRGLQSRLDIARQQVETRRTLLSTVNLQYAKGIAAELQVRQAEGSLAIVNASVPALANALESALNGLDVILGVPAGTHRAELEAAGPIPTAPGIESAGTPHDLLRRRPDLLVAERHLAASNARIGTAISGYYPKVSLGVLVGTASTVGSDLFSSGANQLQGVLGLRWRLFDFGLVDAEIAVAKGRHAEALAAYRQAVLRASADVENAFYSLIQLEQQQSILAAGEHSLARAREASATAYKGGVVSLVEVLNADTTLLAVRDANAIAQTEVARAAVASFRALGGGWTAARS